MIRKGKREIEDRERLVVDRTDGTSFADFECIYLPKTPGKLDVVNDKVTCVFATNGPYIYKVLYDRNIYAGLVFKERTRFELYNDNYPVKITMNKRYIATITKKASDSKPRLLIYRDVHDGGSRYLYGGVNLEEFTNIPAKDIDIKITDDNKVILTVNKKSSLVKVIQLSDMRINVNDVEGLDDFSKQRLIFNEKTSYPANSVPLKYIFTHITMQKPPASELGGSLFGWVLLGLWIFITLFVATMIKRDIEKTKKEIQDSGVEYGRTNSDEGDKMNIDDAFRPELV